MQVVACRVKHLGTGALWVSNLDEESPRRGVDLSGSTGFLRDERWVQLRRAGMVVTRQSGLRGRDTLMTPCWLSALQLLLSRARRAMSTPASPFYGKACLTGVYPLMTNTAEVFDA